MTKRIASREQDRKVKTSMHLRITGDTDSRSGVGEIIDQISGPIRQHFVTRDYGHDFAGLVIVLMCQDLDLKRRIRFSKKEKTLYMDIMLNVAQMASVSSEARKQMILQRIAAEVPEVLSHYTFKDFDKALFLQDLEKCLAGFGLQAR